MALHRKQVKIEEDAKGSGRYSWLRPLLITLLILAFILYVSAFFIVRTDGFRYMAEERLRESWDWPVRVERVWLNPDLSLVLADVESDGFESREGAGIAVREMRLVWSVSRWLNPRRSAVRAVTITGGLFAFQRDENGWRPARFHADAVTLAEWSGLDVGALGADAGPRYVGGDLDVTVRGADAFWYDASGRLLASVQGLHFETAETDLLNRTFRYQRIEADTLFGADRTQQNVNREFLWMDGRALDLE